MNKKLKFSFDVGYASIGWSVMGVTGNQDDMPELVDCGVVLFPKDDCLASSRRDYRRLRRNIRSTRHRISRLGKLFEKLDLIFLDKVILKGHEAPFFLAAQVLQNQKKLTAEELWHVVRWYAQNRGYDGNSRWANEENGEGQEDTKRVQAARALMAELGTSTMAETLCKQLNLDITQPQATFKVHSPSYKVLNLAFPREVVERELAQILQAHIGMFPRFTQEVYSLLMSSQSLDDKQRTHLRTLGIHLPLRYTGGLIFGQLVPRFDNRLITQCPITWARCYDQAITEGKSDDDARHIADKLSKVPSKSTKEFYRYRFARILANLRANGEPLPSSLRQKLMTAAEEHGKLNPSDMTPLIKNALGSDVVTNLHNYFELHPESKEALVLDPARLLMNSGDLKEVTPLLSDRTKAYIYNVLSSGKSITLSSIRDLMMKWKEDTSLFDLKLQELSGKKAKGKVSGKGKAKEFNPHASLKIKKETGRAPYAKPVLNQVVEEILAGYDPSSPAQSPEKPQGELKAEDGVLYCLMNPESRTRILQDSRPLSDLTNNHLIRHRLFILKRLLDEMVAEFAEGDASLVESVVIEVGREISEFSGKTAKEITSELISRMRDFNKAKKYLEDHGVPLSGNMIRKCRIAMDMNWTCPFTNDKYDPRDLAILEKEHLVPHSKRRTNAMSALVLTWPEVNKMKKARTGLEFIKAEQGNPVPGRSNLHILSEKEYLSLADKLDTKGYKDDQVRKKARKKLMKVDKIDYKKGNPTTDDDEDALTFTDGALTQSSHLMKLASKVIKKVLPEAKVVNIPGRVTGELRKSWNVLGCLAQACPDVLYETQVDIDGNPDTEGTKADLRVKEKDEIRNITDLHHALDAMVLGIMEYYVPGSHNGRIWQILVKRNKNEQDAQLMKTIPLKHLYKLNVDKKPLIEDLPDTVKNKMSELLTYCRVMQHISADQGGAKLEETIWRVDSFEGQGSERQVHITQRTYEVIEGKVVRKKKYTKEKASKLMGIDPNGESKLQRVKGAIVIGANFGMALDPAPTIIRHAHVTKQIKHLKELNGGKPIRILRNGMRIKISNHKDPKRNGVWMIKSLKEGGLIDFQRPELNFRPNLKHEGNWQNALAQSLLKSNFEILPQSYTARY